MTIKEMFSEANIGLDKYKNIIGVGVIIMFIVFGATFWYTHSQQIKIAEECGFIDEKIKCVCTKQAWDEFNDRESWNSPITKGLNTSYPSINQYG